MIRSQQANGGFDQTHADAADMPGMDPNAGPNGAEQESISNDGQQHYQEQMMHTDDQFFQQDDHQQMDSHQPSDSKPKRQGRQQRKANQNQQFKQSQMQSQMHEPNEYEIMLGKMEQLRDQCVKEGKLLEAEEAQAKIEELKDEEYNERRTALLSQNDAEMHEMLQQREAHMNEFEQNWNAHEKQLLESSEHDLNVLEENQNQHLVEERQKVDKRLPTAFKPSSTILQHKNVFDRLVKQKKYTEAHALREEFQHMEIEEQEKFLEVREKKINAHIGKQLQHQQTERASLIKKLENQRNEQKRQRMIETAQLTKKFDNAVKEMENRHAVAISQLDSLFEKTISNRPRYQPESVIKPDMAEKSMRMFASQASRAQLMSARSRRM